MPDTVPPVTPDPPRPDPLEVVVVDAKRPIPVDVVGRGPRPDTPTGRPDPLPPDPSSAQLRQEREDLYASNAGRFTIEDEADRRRGPVVVQVKDGKTGAVLTLLCVLHVIKLLLLFWVLMIVMQNRDLMQKADAQRGTIATDLAVLRTGLTEGLAEQQVLVKRVDDALLNLPK